MKRARYLLNWYICLETLLLESKSNLSKMVTKVFESVGRTLVSKVSFNFSAQKANKFQSGFIYQYAFIMLLGFSALLTFLIVR